MAGTYVIRLVVNDGTVDNSPDTVSITATTSGGELDGQTLFSNNCIACHVVTNLTGTTADHIKQKLPHRGMTLDDLGGDAGQAYRL